MVKKGLGRGLDSLIPKKPKIPVKNVERSGQILELPVSKIKPNSHQPRQVMEQAPLDELAASIREHGVIQPLVVTETGDGLYEVLAGERRLRASKMAGLSQVPVVVRTVSKQQKLEVAIVENVQRQDLNPIEEAAAYRRLMNEFNLTQDQVAKRVGKSRSTITNILRTLSLSQSIQKALAEKKISLGHAKMLLSIEDEKERERVFQDILTSRMSVRDVEKSIKKTGMNILGKRKEQDPLLNQYEEKLRQSLGTKVGFKGNKNKGSISINYFSAKELQEIIDRITD